MLAINSDYLIRELRCRTVKLNQVFKSWALEQKKTSVTLPTVN